MSKIYELAKKIKEAGRIIAEDDINKDYYIDGYMSDDTIIVTSDSGYEAIYIGSIFSDSKKAYMCLYTNNTPKRNSYPSTKEIARLLTLVVKGEKLPEGEGKAAYFDYGDMKKQLKYFSEVVCKMAGIEIPKYKLEAANAEDEKYIYQDCYSKDCGYIGHLRGDFGMSGTEYWTTWHNGTDALNTTEFRVEIGELERYLKEQSPTPILKDRATMRYICELHNGFKLADKFADIHLYKVQGKNIDDAKRIIDDAKAVERAGAFAVVLECVPTPLATYITEILSIPTIGIGAGNGCDGQVLVYQDMLGMYSDFTPKFVKKYGELGESMKNCFKEYCSEVKNGTFPKEENSFKMSEEVMKQITEEE